MIPVRYLTSGGGSRTVVAVSTKQEIGEERLRGAHTKKKRGVYTVSNMKNKLFKKQNKHKWGSGKYHNGGGKL